MSMYRDMWHSSGWTTPQEVSGPTCWPKQSQTLRRDQVAQGFPSSGDRWSRGFLGSTWNAVFIVPFPEFA